MSDVVKTLGESFDKQIDRSGKNVVLTKVALRNALKGAGIEGLSTSYMYIINSDKIMHGIRMRIRLVQKLMCRLLKVL